MSTPGRAERLARSISPHVQPLHRHQGPAGDPRVHPGHGGPRRQHAAAAGIFPDQMAPVVRAGADGRELAMMRWGFPCPPSVPGNRAVTNIRNTASSYWRAWMKPENRCLVPATSFCEYAPGKPAVPHWFALGEDRPLFVFAGLWRPWTGVRGTKADPAHGAHELFAFLTCEPNAVVAPVHPKAMPVILTTPEECEGWPHPSTRRCACNARCPMRSCRSSPRARSRTRHLAAPRRQPCCCDADELSALRVMDCSARLILR